MFQMQILPEDGFTYKVNDGTDDSLTATVPVKFQLLFIYQPVKQVGSS